MTELVVAGRIASMADGATEEPRARSGVDP